MPIKIGEIIRKLRKERHITQERLAEYLGISYQAVSKWENGTALPDIALIPALAHFFEVSTDELFGLEPRMADRKHKEYEAEYSRLHVAGDVQGIIALMRKALKEYPRHFPFMLNLAYGWGPNAGCCITD